MRVGSYDVLIDAPARTVHHRSPPPRRPAHVNWLTLIRQLQPDPAAEQRRGSDYFLFLQRLAIRLTLEFNSG
jgi:hypothetical protein